MKKNQIELKYKNREVKCLFELPEVLLGRKDRVEHADGLKRKSCP